MDSSFVSISLKDINENPIKLFGDEWAEIAAGILHCSPNQD